jgi:predicted nucleic acid-binding protein
MSEFFFLDTYAIFEFINGNPAYKKFSSCRAVTTIFNLSEFNYNLKKELDKRSADKITQKYSSILVSVLVEDVINAMDLKVKEKNLSIPDCIGFVVAKRLGAKFLTGDKAFEKMNNVEFVK